MKKSMFFGLVTLSMALCTGCTGNSDKTEANARQNVKNNSDNLVSSVFTIPPDMKLKADHSVTYSFKDVSVHDPSIIETNGEYYIFGSHLAGAKSKDLMNWDLIGSGVTKNNPIIPDARNEMKEAFEWAKTDTFWAPDVIRLADGRYYMYYCTCEGSSPLASLGIAVSDYVEGPYKDLGIILKSGMGPDKPSEDGNIYDATVQPNVVDPCLYYDTEGRLWMSYGSYSGGIFILEMNPKTGFPLEKGYGKKILGGNHVRIEGSYVIYSPETEYYYMFLSFGGLDKNGGYNIRVIRSKTPDGPFYDAGGNDMIGCKGKEGTFFHDESIYQYGVKLMGNCRFERVDKEEGEKRYGYVSPGHNSVLYNQKTGQYFLIFHTRFETKGEYHEVRVHQMYLNEDGWPVVSPYRYAGEIIGSYSENQITGIYKYINHSNTISSEVIISKLIRLNKDHTITGAVSGSWKLQKDGTNILITIGEDTYKGVVNIEWDEPGQKNVMAFTALSDKGIAIWGSGLSPIEQE